ncbi:xanthine dehydrogenase accessory factor [Paenibacillus rhizosphaerae]|uniref:Xanthine dehydrogenase accessory factor n=1 Tax=Paenibacillus rhizosphaerae TaxID=297318 RepID=A0A839TMF4_9BACL|nr:XdhC/CoxI family protein [Paenibacillus rhizosphaerae]MBB3127986.1 xanthine dehydrogenase accessory factor [Paenibacillus rhizosphaerae]
METENILRYVQNEGAPAVLATLVSVRGHAYRKPGAMLLLAADGHRIGSISPGCLEADISARVPRILERGRLEWVSYNTEPGTDPIWGEDMGCGGELGILLEPVEGRLLAILREAAQTVLRGKAAWLVRELRPDQEMDYRLEDDGPIKDSVAGRGAFIFAARLDPSRRLIIFGAGEEAAALEAMARPIGFATAVADWREDWCSKERFPLARTVVGDAGRIAEELRIGRSDYVVLASHHLRRDRDMLRHLLPLQPEYVGVIGSARRIGLLFGELPIPDFVDAPAGLPIGAEGAAEIAVSIAARLVQWRSGAEAAAWERRHA